MKTTLLRWTTLIIMALYTTMALSDHDAPPPEKASSAIEFAKQAGAIAGIAQACGQNIQLLNQRSEEVIQILANTETEKQLATTLFYKTLQIAQHTQQKAHMVKCNDALMELNKL